MTLDVEDCERFDGVANFKEWRSQYPAGVVLEMRNLRGRGDLWVVEGAISYDGGPSQPAVNILEFRDDKVVRETIYVTEPWDAPEWRARWRGAIALEARHEEQLVRCHPWIACSWTS